MISNFGPKSRVTHCGRALDETSKPQCVGQNDRHISLGVSPKFNPHIHGRGFSRRHQVESIPYFDADSDVKVMPTSNP
jgi:hypothetical protein